MLSILSSLWFFVSSPPSVPSNLSPLSVDQLNRLRDSLVPFRDADLSIIVWATVLVTIGVLMEVAEIQHDVRDAARELNHQSKLGELKPIWKLVVAVGWMLVAMGLGLEWWGDARINSVSTDLDTVNQALVQRAEGDAINAGTSAHNAGIDATTARDSARDAQKDAKSAKEIAHEAQTEAAEAEKDREAALQRTARLEQQLSWRTVTAEQIETIGNSLRRAFPGKPLPLSGIKIDTEYSVGDAEGSEYCEELAAALNSLGGGTAGCDVGMFTRTPYGITIWVNSPTTSGAVALQRALKDAGIDTQGAINKDAVGIEIIVGVKPRSGPVLLLHP